MNEVENGELRQSSLSREKSHIEPRKGLRTAAETAGQASNTSKWIAVATRRLGIFHRHFAGVQFFQEAGPVCA